MHIDEKDHLIISVLRDDSRLSIRDIAKKTKLRPSTVHQRIGRLRTNGIIEKFTVKVSNKAMGEGFIVFMLVKTEPTAVIDKIKQSPFVREFFGVTGEYDIMLKLKFKDVEEFNTFVINFRKEQPIQNTMTMVVTADIKEEL